MAASMAIRYTFRTARLSTIFLSKYSTHNCDNVRVRFAPSPTGTIHLGGLRTALLNYLLAKSNGGTFILRIEDTDQTRVVPHTIEKIEDILDWAGLHPDEGPSAGGSYGPYLQSERLQLYQDHVERLLKSGHCYRCFCTKRRLELMKRDAERRKLHPGYDNKCRHLTEAEIQQKLSQNVPHVIRFKNEPLKVPWNDLVFQQVHAGVTEALGGDFIVMKSDGFPTYHFANVVDDHRMKITHVLRGEEWQVSTPYHLQMYEAFGWQPPLYAHLPLILNTDGLKLSKRNKDNSVEYLREIGYTPEAVLNYITTVSGGFTSSTAGATLPEMVATFSLDRVARNHARLQPEKLATVSRSHIQRQLRGDRAGLVDRTRQLVRQTFADRLTDTDDQKRLLSDHYIESVLCWGAEHRISRIGELTSKQLQFVWVCPSDKDIHYNINPSLDFVRVLSDVRDRLGLVEEYSEEGLKEELTCYCAESGLGMKVYMALLRTVLGGDKVGPPVAEMMSIIGKAETLRRLDHALSVLRPTETRDVVR